MPTTIPDALPDYPNAPRGVLSGDVRGIGWLTAQVAEQAGSTLVSQENLKFLALLMAVREIDTSIEDLLEGRGELSRYMGMAKLAGTEPGTSQLTENQVLAPEVEAGKITGRIRDLAVMLDKKEYEDKALKTLLIQCIQELFPLIFAHSREIQMGLKYADFEVQQGVDAYKNLGELDTIKENLRDNITAKDMELLRAIIARMRLINTYLGVFSPEESQQLLPAVKDPFLRTIFQEINNLCSRARGSRGIPANARPW